MRCKAEECRNSGAISNDDNAEARQLHHFWRARIIQIPLGGGGLAFIQHQLNGGDVYEVRFQRPDGLWDVSSDTADVHLNDDPALSQCRRNPTAAATGWGSYRTVLHLR